MQPLRRDSKPTTFFQLHPHSRTFDLFDFFAFGTFLCCKPGLVHGIELTLTTARTAMVEQSQESVPKEQEAVTAEEGETYGDKLVSFSISRGIM